MEPQSRRASETETTEWLRAGTALASTIRQHQPVDGYCPLCTWSNGRPQPAPCDVTVEAQVAFRDLCGEP